MFLKSSTHPRAYGNFARLLGQVRARRKGDHAAGGDPPPHAAAGDELELKERGCLTRGYFADVVVFDPATIEDHATYEKPHQYAIGMEHVFVNGVQVLRTASTRAPSRAASSAARVVGRKAWTQFTAALN